MKFVRLKASAWKEFTEIGRDPRSLLLAISIPVLLLLLLFGYALTLDVDLIPMVIYDLDRTPRGRDLADHFLHSKYFQLPRRLRLFPTARDAGPWPGPHGPGDPRELLPWPGVEP